MTSISKCSLQLVTTGWSSTAGAEALNLGTCPQT